MALLLVPHESSQTTVTLWVGGIDEPGVSAQDVEVVPNDPTLPPVPLTGWDVTVAGRTRWIGATRVVVNGLRPGRRYGFELRRQGRRVSDASTNTLPDHVPRLDERPLTILLGSCFAVGRDGAGNAGRAYALLPSALRPDLKILCGDQVYLDAFGLQTIFTGVSRAELTDRFIGSYAAAWTQEPGFRQLLRDAPTVFTSDDHDYWNNAPNSSLTAPQTRTEAVRKDWWAAALDLFRTVQHDLPRDRRTLSIGDLSIYVADTRIGRGPGTDVLLAEPDLAAIEQWAAGLAGPGCLVVGQLMFGGRASWIGRHMDFGLPDFRADYARLVAALRRATHSVVILTGDVHFGRVAVAQIAPGREVVEVVASPLSLVFPFPPHDWKAAPDTFPVDAIPGLGGAHVWTDETYRLNSNHFATVQFTRSGAFTRMRVLAWPVETNGAIPTPVCTFERWLA